MVSLLRFFHSGAVREYKKQILPSQFNNAPPPVFYHLVADRIYQEGQLIDKSHDHVYEAKLELPLTPIALYRLVLHGDTKIVKTMYPVEVTRRQKPTYVMTSGTRYECCLQSGLIITEYNFKDSKERVRFILRVTYQNHQSLEKREIFLAKRNKISTLLYYTDFFPSRLNTSNLGIFYLSLRFPEEEAIIINHKFGK